MADYYSALLASGKWAIETRHAPRFFRPPHPRGHVGVQLAFRHGVGGAMLCGVVGLNELDPSVLDGFTCGDEWMDDRLTRKAPRQLAGGLCVMRVGLDGDGRAVGFFTLSNCRLEPTGIPRRGRRGFNRTSFGAFLIGEIAVREDLRHADYGYGVRLLNHAVKLSCDIAKDVGASFAVVSPRDGDEALCRWYQRNGFVRSPEGFRHYLPIPDGRSATKGFGKRLYGRAWRAVLRAARGECPEASCALTTMREGYKVRVAKAPG